MADSQAALLAKLRANAAALMASKAAGKPTDQLLAETSALVMELRGSCDGGFEAHAAGAGEVEKAKRRHAEADDEMRALKYQRRRILRAVDECTAPPEGSEEAEVRTRPPHPLAALAQPADVRAVCARGRRCCRS